MAITLANSIVVPLYARVMSTLASVLGSFFWKKLLCKAIFLCDVKTRICKTPVLRKEFRMMRTTQNNTKIEEDSSRNPNHWSFLNRQQTHTCIRFGFFECRIRRHAKCRVRVRGRKTLGWYRTSLTCSWETDGQRHRHVDSSELDKWMHVYEYIMSVYIDWLIWCRKRSRWKNLVLSERDDLWVALHLAGKIYWPVLSGKTFICMIEREVQGTQYQVVVEKLIVTYK